MDKVLTNAVIARAFCLTTSAARSRIHFFPSAGSTAGHYPVACEITIFGKGIERRSVHLDGGRLNQPDGIRLEDAFPALASEVSGIFGLEVSLSSSQGRMNLLSSRLVVEIVSSQFLLSFGAAPFSINTSFDSSTNQTDLKAQIGITELNHDQIGARATVVMHDSICVPSLVIVNSSSELVRPDFRHRVGTSEDTLHLGTVAPESVVDFPLDDALCKYGEKHQALWGDVVIEKIWGKPQPGVECYILNRECKSKRPISVCAV